MRLNLLVEFDLLLPLVPLIPCWHIEDGVRSFLLRSSFGGRDCGAAREVLRLGDTMATVFVIVKILDSNYGTDTRKSNEDDHSYTILFIYKIK